MEKNVKMEMKNCKVIREDQEWYENKMLNKEKVHREK